MSHGLSAIQEPHGSLSNPLRAGKEAVFVLPWNFPDYPFGGTQVQLYERNLSTG